MSVSVSDTRIVPRAEEKTRHVSGWIGGIIVVLALVSALLTFLVLSGSTPIAPVHEVVIGVFVLNALLILALMVIVVFEAAVLIRARKAGAAAAGLHVRIVGLFSHVSNTSPEDDRAALAAFEAACAEADANGIHPELRHLAATAAAIDLPETRFDAVRIGIGLYGVSPFDDRNPGDLGLRPAMTLRGAVAAVRRVPAGTGVSYGYTHRTQAETTLALIPLGYADGVPRQASGRGPVQIGGRRYTVAGRIAMDQFLVDVGDDPVAVGDEAVLFGDPTLGVPSARDWADAADTIDYEIVTRIGPRVPRRSVS